MKVTFGSESPGPGWVSDGNGKWTKGAPEIAVIGGGPSGLFATYLINQRLHEVVVTLFESSNRLGGKIRTDHFSDGTPFEAGVAELYEYLGKEKDPLRRLVEDDLGLHTQDMSGGGVILGDTVLRDLDEVEANYGKIAREQIDKFHKRMTELMPLSVYAHRWQPDNNHPWAKLTFREAIRKEVSDPKAIEYIEAAVASDLATESWTCNGLNGIKNVLLDNDKYTQLYHVVGGIGQVAERLTEEIDADVRERCRVTAVSKEGANYRVWWKQDGKESYRDFDAVIVCLPNHWLTQIKWSGKLADAVHETCAHYDLPAHYLRVSMLFRSPWWKRLGMPGDFWMCDMMNGCCVYDESTRWKARNGGHVLSFLISGQDALLLNSQNQSDEEIIEAVLDRLPQCMGEAQNQLIEAQVDRYAGSINAMPGGFPAEKLLGAHTPEPNSHQGVFLCCDAFFDSTLNGALISASTAVGLLGKFLDIEEEETDGAVKVLAGTKI